MKKSEWVYLANAMWTYSDKHEGEISRLLKELVITVNKNMVPFDDKSPFVTSGIRIGTAAVTTRGLKEEDMLKIVDFIDQAINSKDDDESLNRIASDVKSFMGHRPLFES